MPWINIMVQDLNRENILLVTVLHQENEKKGVGKMDF